ncbi:MAG: 3-deoxy-manno-octulosonate cytidylyltransferase [Deltaproteobacteria bacterium]|nr:3-deoxy-manno-octulosonate cytidylyltransferase [Deltaproteobacteria bacterium]MBW1961105.1 3-deoxy-manno-octulosonate cytidylyltransferase [Deltaproteobacteria bacterium]MBW1995914.1 3-deoxy-manno-octulosonate cytidylyltransferase [Deltaproteobacteria bacterium]MBW2150477.1 3-deoxy-manno-octulosonate cytidylyltransferase [Deltaproteobacteria bacterium]
MKIVVIIPARYASTRFDGKALVSIAGKSMIQRVYERSVKAQRVSKVVVATDDLRIIEAVEKFGGKAIMTSDKNRTGTDRVAEAAEKLGLELNDIVINVQGDQPLLDPRCLDQVVDPLLTESNIDISTLAVKIFNEREKTDPKDIKVTFDNKGFALYFSRSTIPFGRDGSFKYDVFKHLGVYAYTRRFLEVFRHLPSGRLEEIEKLEQLRALEHGYRIRVVQTPYDSPEVDLPIDIERIEKILENMPDALK